jgi:3-hydroxyacyl-[acyl-carrier-protein] dehydratase
MDIHQILKSLPHRYPFLLVDKVIECDSKALVAIKNVTINEPFFQGHFPGLPIMPGVLILEAMAQATGLLAYHNIQDKPNPQETYYLLVGVDDVRFKKPVKPGDQLIIHVRLEKEKRGIYIFDVMATVDGATVASAKIMTTKSDADL